MDNFTRENRFHESAIKIRKPFKIDPSLCIYSPQENIDSLKHPKIKNWQNFVQNEWIPSPIPKGTKRLALIIPCTKYKPYITSREHKAINSALLSDGWKATGNSDAPPEFEKLLEKGDNPEIFHEGFLKKRNLILERIVISEPLGIVPYQYMYFWNGKQSPATSYDDPGLFESRGTSVSPYRPDSSATKVKGGKWKWGNAERSSYVDMHNHLVKVIASSLKRVRNHYHGIVAWVSPGLTHRSFLSSKKIRLEEGISSSRKIEGGRKKLYGVLDLESEILKIMPTIEQLKISQHDLEKRLRNEGRNSSPQSVRSIYARGDGNDTPLGLKETLEFLLTWLNKIG